jgi:hypothetical protein
MKTFQFKDLMINVAPAGEKARLCGFGLTHGCGYGYSCYPFTCQIGLTHCYLYTAEQAAAPPAAEYACADSPGVTEIAVAAGPEKYPCGVTELKCEGTLFATPRIQLDPEGVKKQLAAIKAQLQQELAAVELSEKAVAEVLRPHTLAEVEQLRGKLREALAELDKRKQELQKTKKRRKK